MSLDVFAVDSALSLVKELLATEDFQRMAVRGGLPPMTVRPAAEIDPHDAGVFRYGYSVVFCGGGFEPCIAVCLPWLHVTSDDQLWEVLDCAARAAACLSGNWHYPLTFIPDDYPTELERGVKGLWFCPFDVLGELASARMMPEYACQHLGGLLGNERMGIEMAIRGSWHGEPWLLQSDRREPLLSLTSRLHLFDSIVCDWIHPDSRLLAELNQLCQDYRELRSDMCSDLLADARVAEAVLAVDRSYEEAPYYEAVGRLLTVLVPEIRIIRRGR